MGQHSVFIFAFFIFFPFFGSSQESNDKLDDWFAIGPGFGITYYLEQEFSTQFEQGFAEKSYVSNLRLFGPITDKREFYIDLGYYLPQKFSRGDSVTYKFSGAYLGIPWQTFRFQLIDGQKNDSKLLFSTPLYLGTEMGWMWLKENQFRQRNFFLNLKIQIEPRLVLFQRLVIGTGLIISYDMTRSEWKTREDFPVSAVGFRNTAFSVNASLAWILTNKKKSNIR